MRTDGSLRCATARHSPACDRSTRDKPQRAQAAAQHRDARAVAATYTPAATLPKRRWQLVTHSERCSRVSPYASLARAGCLSPKAPLLQTRASSGARAAEPAALPTLAAVGVLPATPMATPDRSRRPNRGRRRDSSSDGGEGAADGPDEGAAEAGGAGPSDTASRETDRLAKIQEKNRKAQQKCAPTPVALWPPPGAAGPGQCSGSSAQ